MKKLKTNIQYHTHLFIIIYIVLYCDTRLLLLTFDTYGGLCLKKIKI